MYSSTYIEVGLHSTSKLHNYSLDCEDAETSLTQLVKTVAADLNRPTRVSPSYSHQSQGKVERFHRNLFDQLRTTSLQWSGDLKIEPHMLPPESLPWALQQDIFILVHSSGKTSHFENYRFQHRRFWRACSRRRPQHPNTQATTEETQRSQHQKLRGIWLGRDLITNERILAPPLQYSEHPSMTTAYKCRQIARVPRREEQHDLNFLKDIYWPQLSDDINFKTREHLNNLQTQNIATRDLQLQEPQDEEDIEQPPGVSPPVLPQEQHLPTQQMQPPPGLPQPPQAVLPQGACAMLMHIKAHLARFPEHVAVQLDFKNAFCTLHHQTCLEVVEKRLIATVLV